MGAKPKYEVNLGKQEYQDLLDILGKGVHNAREVKRAQILLWAHEGKPNKEIAQLARCSTPTVTGTRKRFNDGGLEQALFDKPRSGRPRKMSAKDDAKLTAIACSEPPEGRDRWTLMMLRDELVQLSDLESISHEAVRQALKKTNSSPGFTNSGS